MEKAIVAFNTATDAIQDNECYSIIARALQAARNEERERCAKIAFDHEVSLAEYPSELAEHHYQAGTLDMALGIASAIRKGGE